MGRLFWIVVAVMGGGLVLLVANDSSGEVLGMDAGDFGRLVYLGALGAVVAVAVHVGQKATGLGKGAN